LTFFARRGETMPSKVKGKKFHFSGNDETGRGVFIECDKTKKAEELTVVTAENMKPGEPVPLGYRVANFKDVDGQHVVINDLEDEAAEAGVSGGGPPMVASTAFREGWARTFGSKGVN
jgi:hypothetical protein